MSPDIVLTAEQTIGKEKSRQKKREICALANYSREEVHAPTLSGTADKDDASSGKRWHVDHPWVSWLIDKAVKKSYIALLQT